jgi:hypothetical protein
MDNKTLVLRLIREIGIELYEDIAFSLSCLEQSITNQQLKEVLIKLLKEGSIYEYKKGRFKAL